MSEKQSLLEYLQAATECEYLSGVRDRAAKHDVRLVKAIERLSPDAYSLREWNDALNYLACGVSCKEAQTNTIDARKCLLCCLSGCFDYRK